MKNPPVIWLTRPEPAILKTASALTSAGYKVLPLPLIEVGTLLPDKPLDLPQPDWIVFVSANAIDGFVRAQGSALVPRTTSEDLKVAAVGRKSAERAQASGFAVDFWPEEQTATGLIRRFNELEMQGKTVWIPAGNLPGSATRDLPEALRTMQAHPIVFQVYATQIRTLKADELSQLDQSLPKAIVFHSPSSADALFQSTAPELIAIREKAQLIAIGTVTQARLQEYSAKDIALCESADDAGVLDALNSLFKPTR